MSFLDELIKTIQEAVDEANGRPPRPVATSSRPTPMDSSSQDQVRERLRRRYEEARHAQSEAELAERKRSEAQQRAIADATAAASTPAVVTNRPEHPFAASSASRISQLLRQPNTVREMVLLREVLDRPLSLRGPRR
jgi:hypothetical protein